MSYIVGIDGGGTKTAFLVYNTDNGFIRKLERDSIAVQDHGFEAFREIIGNTVDELTSGHCEEVTAVCAGIPCYGEYPDIDRQTAGIIESLFTKSHNICVNDCVVGYTGALELQPGINIVAGTGAIAYGEDREGKSARSNGWSGEFSDEGSCCWLGNKCLELFCKQSDNRLPRMSLHNIVRKYFSLQEDMEIMSIYEEKYKGKRREIANLQILLYQAATDGDSSAQEAYGRAAGELVLSIDAIRKSLCLTGTIAVSYSGGLFKAGDLILSPLREKLFATYPEYSLNQPLYSPEAGALMMAARAIRYDLMEIKSTIKGTM